MNRRNLKPLDRTDDQIDALATITPQDVEQAGVDWRRWADAKWKNLLEATEEDGEPDTAIQVE